MTRRYMELPCKSCGKVTLLHFMNLCRDCYDKEMLDMISRRKHKQLTMHGTGGGRRRR